MVYRVKINDKVKTMQILINWNWNSSSYHKIDNLNEFLRVMEGII